MSKLNSHLFYQINDCKAENVAIFGNVRVSVLTEKLFRVEFSKNGEFSDLPTQKVLHRNFANPNIILKIMEIALLLKQIL